MSWSSVVTTCVVVGSCLYIARENWMRRLWRIFMELLSLGTPSGARFAGALIFGLAWDVSESISGRERNSVDKSTIKYLIESVDVLSWVGGGGSWAAKPIGLRSTAYGGGGSLCWAQWRAREEERKKKKKRKKRVRRPKSGREGGLYTRQQPQTKDAARCHKSDGDAAPGPRARRVYGAGASGHLSRGRGR